MKSEETKYFDLFEHYNLQPPKLAAVVSKYSSEEYQYIELEKFLNEVNKIGFTFDYGLDALPYGLRPLNVSLHQLEEEN